MTSEYDFMTPAQERRGYATAPSYSERWQRRLGAGITPQAITAAQRLADTGNMAAWADLLDESRQGDPHLHGDLFKREWGVAGAPLEIRAPAGVASGKGTLAARAVALCRDVVDGFEVPRGSLAVGLRGALAHIQTALYHGRAALEATWRRDGRYFVPRVLYPIHARRLAWAAHDWKLHVWDSTAGDTRFSLFPGVAADDTAVFPDGKLLVHLPRVFGTYPTREGLGRGLVWFSGFKRWTIRDWLAFAQWAGRGLRVGKYRTGRDPKTEGRANEEDKQALQDALDAMSSTTSVVLPDVTDATILAAQDNEVHQRLVVLCNAEMSKMVLGGTLTSDAGEKGARSLGDVHLAAAVMLMGADAAALADTVRRDLFGPVVRANLGDSAPVPELALQVAPADDLDAFAKRIALLVPQGLRVGQGFVRDTLGVPDPVGDEPVMGAAKPATPADGARMPPAAEPT